MIKAREILIALLAAFILMSDAAPARAQGNAALPAGSMKLGVLNVTLVFRNSLMTKDIDRQIDAKRREFREEILKEEDGLRELRKDLEGKRVLLTPQAFAGEARKFRNLEGELQKKVQKRSREFNEFRNLATRAFERALNTAVLAFAKENNYTLILRQRQVVLRADALDVTKAVIKVIDKAMPRYKIADRPPKPGK